MTDETFTRPNGKPYRPRKAGLRAQAWENHGHPGEELSGVIVFGTLDPERARQLAQDSCTWWYGDSDLNQLTDATPGWWRDTFRYSGRTFVEDDERGSAGVMFTWGEVVTAPNVSGEPR